jgi:hypothetical protein
MKNRNKWYIKQDRYYSPERALQHSFTITLDPEAPGWNTDFGYEVYGLPKELAQWICDILNKSEKECPFHMKCGKWVKNEK